MELEQLEKREKRMANKFKILFKDPDGVFDCVEEAGYDLNDLPTDVERVLNKFLDFKEMITIEFDIEKGMARVVYKGE